MTDSKNTVSVSVVTANYNNEKFISDFVESVCNSTVLPSELIFVDDASTDNSLEEINKFSKYSILKIISLKKNVGFSNALNVGIEHATCKYIMRLDSDDFITKDRIRRQFEFLESHPEIAIIGSNILYFCDKKQAVIFKSNMPITCEQVKKAYMNGENGLMHSTVMGRSVIYKKYRYNHGQAFPQDYDLFSRMIRDGYPICNLPEYLTFYRIHNKNSSNFMMRQKIKQIHSIRSSLFNKQTSYAFVYANYLHLYFYRKFLSESNMFAKILYVAISSLFRVNKVLKRML